MCLLVGRSCVTWVANHWREMGRGELSHEGGSFHGGSMDYQAIPTPFSPWFVLVLRTPYLVLCTQSSRPVSAGLQTDHPRDLLHINTGVKASRRQAFGNTQVDSEYSVVKTPRSSFAESTRGDNLGTFSLGTGRRSTGQSSRAWD